ncbi:MAG: hypothetical protein RL298_1975, partial [Pseudomonadota bacterium]
KNFTVLDGSLQGFLWRDGHDGLCF